MSFRHVVAVFALLVSAGLFAQAPADKPAEAAAPAPPPGATPADAPAQASAAAVKPGDATAGQAKAGVCAACHGIDGNPASSQYPKLAGQHETYIVRQVGLFKSHKRDSPIMMGFAMPLGDQDMHDIGAYFASKTSLPGVADTKLVARGEALYRGGDAQAGIPACASCHAANGGGIPKNYPRVGGQHADYTYAQLQAFKAGQRGNDKDGKDVNGRIMVDIASRLSDAQMKSLADYMAGLR